MSTIKFNFVEYRAFSRRQYRQEKTRLQIELLRLQEWVISERKRVAVIVEGRDAAGKGSTIKRFIENLIERKTSDLVGYRIVSLGIPTPAESKHWFERYEIHLPKEGELVFFDRSWYNRAVVEPAMGYCSESQYREFMANVNDWESDLIDQGVIIIKLYLSISKEKQLERIRYRKNSPLKYWKFSKHDLVAFGRWETFTCYENKMLQQTSTLKSPWVIIDANNRMISRLNAIRYVLDVINYGDKDWHGIIRRTGALRTVDVSGVRLENLNSKQLQAPRKLKEIQEA